MSPVIAAVIAVVVGVICGLLGYTYRKNFTEKKIERTEDYAKRLWKSGNAATKSRRMNAA